ncbi:MAG: adenylate/guanylate cyclase domain-containing protein [Pseudomonadota bacterium]
MEQESRQRLATSLMSRNAALFVVGILLFFLVPWPGVLYYEVLIGVFILLGFAQNALAKSRHDAGWHVYAFITLNFALLTLALLYPNPFSAQPHTPQFQFRFGNFTFYYLILVSTAFFFDPRLVIWGGISGALCWLIGLAINLAMPETVWTIDEDAFGAQNAQVLALLGNPYFIDVGIRVQEVVVFLVISGLLALVVHGSRSLIVRQVTLERRNSNLARYLPPALAERLAVQDQPFERTFETEAAILFADIVGFTRWAEAHGPVETIALLREVQGIIESAVFAHGGVLDKFIGDGVMASFGTMQDETADPAAALACCADILGRMDAWAERRQALGAATVEVSLGLHFGSVIVGDVGSERRMERAVLGDAVNVASRLETLTRRLGVRALVSDALIARVEERPATFRALGPLSLPGRTAPVPVWAL